MSDARTIHFVTDPAGDVYPTSPNGYSEDRAIANVLRDHLAPSRFGLIDWGGRWAGAIYYIWPAMQKIGWKVHSMPVSDSSGEDA